MTLTIIDTFGFLFRNFYALPKLKSKNGTPTGMLTGFLNFIASLGRDFPTDFVVFSLDSKEKTFRKELYPEYKANRKEPEEELKTQLPIAIELIKEMGFKMIEMPGFESDDIIASLAKIASEKGIKVQIVTHDKDMYQLIDDEKIVIFDPSKKEIIDEKKAIEKFGVHPKDFINFQALVGDSSDNIPGVKGIGVKTAAKLINKYHTLENLYDHIDEIKGAIQKKLIEGKENAFLSRKLVTLKTDLFDDINLEEFKYPEINPILKVSDKLIDLDITSVIERVKKDGLFIETKEPKKEEENKFDAILIENEKELFKIVEKIDGLVAFDTETDSLENPKIVGFSFAFEEGKAYYVPINHNYLGVSEQISEESAIKAIKKILSNPFIGHNLKFDLKMLRKYGIEATPLNDTMILAWLINPDEALSLDKLADKYLNYKMIKFKEITKGKKSFAEVDIETATKYASEDALISLKLYKILKNRLWEEVKWDLENIEIPFINLLIDIENEGIKLDIKYMEKLKKEFATKLEILTNEIYNLAGSEFNIRSTKQLAHILFEVLKLPPKKKTKTGYSTDEKTLNSLKEKHPIIEKILEYRTYEKLQSTYVIPLINYAKKDKNHKIYTNFLQTGTATGRLSSKDPNLQNIPVSSELNIRNGFVAENMFVSLDYSQIELRLLAHYSEDPHLIEAFLNDRDIHLETAKKLFGDEAEEKRGIAKSINFGLIYGMGARKLSETIKVSNKEAKEFIEKYFANFPKVKEFIEKAKLDAREKGYVETLLKRRRFFDFNSANERVQANFEREAVNTIFQGSAADIIKKAMLEIKKEFPNSKMLLQIHDELIFDIKDKEEAIKYKEIMENSFKLKVPLKVGVSFGKRWGELK